MSNQPMYFYFYDKATGRISSGVRCDPDDAADLAKVALARNEGVIESTDELDLFEDRVDLTTGQIVDRLDAAFAADQQRQFDRITQIFPRLLEAVPPAAPPPRQNGTFRFSSEAVWSELVASVERGEPLLRAPVSAPTATMEGPFRAYGDCLDPVLAEDRGLDWYDPNLPAQDGDIVLVKWDPLVLQEICERGADKPEWLAQYPNPGPIATKLLKAFQGEYWLVTNSSMLRLGKNKILGVLRYSQQDGSRLFEPLPVMNIRPNAATEVYEAEETAVQSFGFGTFVATSLTFTPSVSAEVIVSASYEYEGFDGDSGHAKGTFCTQSSATTYGTSSSAGAGTRAAQSNRDSFSVVAGSLVEVGLALNNAVFSSSMKFWNVKIVAELIKL